MVGAMDPNRCGNTRAYDKRPSNRRSYYRTGGRSGSCDRERLLKKLIETEMDGQEAARQAGTLKVSL